MNKFEECDTCMWHDEPTICEGCDNADQYEPDDSHDDNDDYSDGVAELKRMIFVPRHVEIVDDPDEGIPDYLLCGEEHYG